MQQPESPICSEVRSKKYFFLQAAPMKSEDLLDNSNDCWCAVTADRLGPDAKAVHPDLCRAGRSCFRSIFGARVS